MDVGLGELWELVMDRENNKVILNPLLAIALIFSRLFTVLASDISGIRRPAKELRIADGNKTIGNTML